MKRYRPYLWILYAACASALIAYLQMEGYL